MERLNTLKQVYHEQYRKVKAMLGTENSLVQMKLEKWFYLDTLPKELDSIDKVLEDLNAEVRRISNDISANKLGLVKVIAYEQKRIALSEVIADLKGSFG